MVDYDNLRHISHTTSMLELLDYYNIEYHPSGINRFKAVCPFHDDHDPSLVIYVQENHKDESFYCFVDNLGGDPFRFLQLMEQDFKKAWSVLCHIRGIKADDAFEIDDLELASQQLAREQHKESVSVSSYNYQISVAYRDFLSSYKDSDRYDELQTKVDQRLASLDTYLDQNPSAVAMRQYYLHELQYLSSLQNSATSAQ